MNMKTDTGIGAPSCGGSPVSWARGFSLIELLISISIVGLLLGVGFPGYRDYTERQRAVSLANQIVADIHLARGEALRSEGEVSMVPAGASWMDGWQIVVNQGGKTRLLASRDPVEGVRVSSGGESVAGIVFSPLGGLEAPSGGMELEVCSSSDGLGRPWRVVVNGAGFVEARKPADPTLRCG